MMHKRRGWVVLLVLAILFLSAGAALAADGLSIRPSLVGGGGGVAQAGGFRIQSSVGQGTAALTTQGSFALCSGYWCEIESVFKTFIPEVSR